MDDSNKQLLKTVEEKLDEFFANGTWRGGVKEEEVQDLIDFAEDSGPIPSRRYRSVCR